jgi:Cu(I)/Ag(I) efflux system membrane fusion protein
LGVASEAKDVSAALKSVDMGLFKGDAHMVWMDQLKTLKSSIASIGQSSDIEKQRNAFAKFNLAFYKSLKTFGLKNDTAYFQYCPMANREQGVYWLSETEEIRNPYFGDEMLGCGENRETIK